MREKDLIDRESRSSCGCKTTTFVCYSREARGVVEEEEEDEDEDEDVEEGGAVNRL